MATDFLKRYKDNLPLTPAQKQELVEWLQDDIQFDDFFAKPTQEAEGLGRLLSEYGRLWVTLDRDPGNRRQPHAVVVTDVSREPSENAVVKYYDVFEGIIKQNNFTDFVLRVKQANDEPAQACIRPVKKAGEGAGIPASYTIPAGLEVYVLMAGFNYSSRKYSFADASTKYRKKKVAARVNASIKLIFIEIDCKGQINYFENNKLVAQKQFTPVGPANYPLAEKYFQFLSKGGYVSKNTLFGVLNDLGTTNAGQVKECGIFSHAWAGGPILYNTFVDDPARTNDQFDDFKAIDSFYEDLDLRVSDITNLSGRFPNVKNAFASDGAWYIWGCNSNGILNLLIKRILSGTGYKADGSNADTDIITMNDGVPYQSTEKLSVTLNKAFTFLHTAKGYVSNFQVNGPSISFALKDIKVLFATLGIIQFGAVLSSMLDMTVHTALPGTYAMVGPSHGAGDPGGIFRISHDTKMNANFFTAYMGVTVDSLKYGVYTKSLIDAWKLM